MSAASGPPQPPAALFSHFARVHGSAPDWVWWAPARVNLIGDHIDYCGGLVLPMAIQHGTWVAGARTDDDLVSAVSVDQPGTCQFQLGTQELANPGWGAFVHGVVQVLAEQGAPCTGLRLAVEGDVPGGGLSSSASLCVALVRALGSAWGWTPGGGDLHLAELCQSVEQRFVGVNCGLMDPMAIQAARPGEVLAFDCAAGHTQGLPWPEDPVLLVLDSGRARRLVGSVYNDRRAALEACLEQVRDPLGVDRLTAIGPERLADALGLLTDSAHQPLLRHVVTEQARSQQAVAALRVGDMGTLGRLLDESHASLRDDFAVSCRELDLLTEAVRQCDGVLGARLTGAGFGGWAVALVEAGAVEQVRSLAAEAYHAASGLSTRSFVARNLGGPQPQDLPGTDGGPRT